MTEAVRTSKTSLYMNEATSQKAVISKAAVDNICNVC